MSRSKSTPIVDTPAEATEPEQDAVHASEPAADSLELSADQEHMLRLYASVQQVPVNAYRRAFAHGAAFARLVDRKAE